MPILPAKEKPNLPEDAYNFFQSSFTMHLKQAFGRLLTRRRLIWSQMGFGLDATVQMIEVAMILHKFCKETDSNNSFLFFSGKEHNETLHIAQE